MDSAYQGQLDVKLTAKNLPLKGIGDPTTLWNKVMKEVKAKHFAGPFTQIPFHDHYIESLIGLVPKDNGKETHLIFHLSYPKDNSVNDGTPDELCTVKYPEFEEAIQLCIAEGKNCKISKSDKKSAFRNLCIRKEDFWLLVISCRNPDDLKMYHFFDKCLPFGHLISCNLFQHFSNSIAHVMKFCTHKDVVNFLDDYLFTSLFKHLCDQQVNLFIQICGFIGLPVNLDKTVWGTTRLVFLGLLIDTNMQMVFVPIEKIDKAKSMINAILNNKKHKATLLQMQQICGFLNFLGKCVIPGRAFTRRLYTLTTTLEGKLKPHHHLTVNTEFRWDLCMWKQFLDNPTVYCRPFMHYVGTGSFLFRRQWGNWTWSHLHRVVGSQKDGTLVSWQGVTLVSNI